MNGKSGARPSATNLQMSTSRRRAPALVAGCITALAMAASAPAQAQGRSSSATVQVSIPPGDLGTVLSAFSRAANLQVVVDPDLIAGKRSAGLSGSFAASDALAKLLAGSGLTFALEGDTVVVKPTPVLPVSVAAAMSAPPMSMRGAQQTDIEEIIVTAGFASSLARALLEKRQAATVIDVISAEDIGKFPTQNLAEALQRVPGVAITRDRGEGLFVRVRGLGPSFQTVNVNGRGAAVNENVRDSNQSGRQFRFDTLPSELVSSVEVIKSPTAAMDEGAIGGIVNVRTAKPLELARSTVAGSATASSPELADTVDPRISSLASWSNDANTFGVLTAVVYDERTLRQDRITGVSWSMNPGVDTNGDGVADSGPLTTPDAARPTLEREERERIGLNTAVQWRPNSDIDLGLDIFYTQLNDKYDELTYSSDFNLRTIVPGSARINGGVLTAATVNGQSQIGREVSELEHDNTMVALNGVYRPGDWTLSADLVFARADSSTPTPITRTRLLGPVGQIAFSFGDADGALPSINFLTADLNNPGLLPGRRVEWRNVDSIDQERAAQFDAQHPLSFGPISGVQFGGKYRTRLRDYERRDYNFTNGIAGQRFGAAFFDAFPFQDFLGEVSGNLPRNWAMPDPDVFATRINLAELNAPLSRTDLRNSYEVEEKIGSIYALTELQMSLIDQPLHGNFGVRAARTDQTSSGHADNGTRAIPVSFNKVYTDLLPSLNLAWEVTADTQLRLAAAKVITRPSLADLAPRLTLNSSGTVLEAVGGNPQLKPFEAWQYDITTEWYFAPGSALVGGIFYKDITTFLTRRRSNIVVDGVPYVLTAPVNGGTASVAGVELAYQQKMEFLPAPWNGMGLVASYTNTTSEATYFDGARTFKDDLENVANNSFNVTAFYEHGRFAGRFSYSWFGDVLQEVGTNGLATANDKAFGSLDSDFSIKLNEQFSFVFQAINLLDEEQRQFIRANDMFAGYTRYGRSLMLGVRAAL